MYVSLVVQFSSVQSVLEEAAMYFKKWECYSISPMIAVFLKPAKLSACPCPRIGLIQLDRI